MTIDVYLQKLRGPIDAKTCVSDLELASSLAAASDTFLESRGNLKRRFTAAKETLPLRERISSVGGSDGPTNFFGSSVAKKNGSGIFAEDRIVQPSDSAALRILFRDKGDTGESELSQSHESIDPDTKLPSLNGLRVLVVDDEPDSRELLTILLTHYGAEVTTVRSVEAAVKAFQEGMPDVLLSDIGMPDGDGYALIRQIRALEGDRPDKLPALALTSYTQPEDRDRAIAAGYQMHVTKPVEPLELVNAIASLAKRR